MRFNGIVGTVLCIAWLAMPSPARAQPATAPATQPAIVLPHIQLDREHRWVDLEATVVLRDAEWLELLACSPKSREHESVLTIPARPSHVHLALLLLGLQPGSPMKWWREGDVPKFSPPRGPRVAVTILMEKDGRQVEIPANEWVMNQKTKQVMASNIWLFAGSEFSEFEGQKIYRADLGGTLLSLVNFGDDLLSRDTSMTNMDDDSTWGVNTKAVPPVGTKVTVRLKPLDDKAPATRPVPKQ